jgi:hypothetical protein
VVSTPEFADIIFSVNDTVTITESVSSPYISDYYLSVSESVTATPFVDMRLRGLGGGGSARRYSMLIGIYRG